MHTQRKVACRVLVFRTHAHTHKSTLCTMCVCCGSRAERHCVDIKAANIQTQQDLWPHSYCPLKTRNGTWWGDGLKPNLTTHSSYARMNGSQVSAYKPTHTDTHTHTDVLFLLNIDGRQTVDSTLSFVCNFDLKSLLP